MFKLIEAGAGVRCTNLWAHLRTIPPTGEFERLRDALEPKHFFPQKNASTTMMQPMTRHPEAGLGK